MADNSSGVGLRSIVCGGALALAGLAGASATSTGCGSDSKDFFVVQFDGGSDAEEDGAADAEPDFDPTLGGPCTDDSQCDDLIPCTYDRCDTTLSRCRNTPDDTQCADSEYCNGQEKCVLRKGCVPGPVVTCQDGNVCTIDRCVEATRSCERSPRDSDGDGDPDDHCVPKRDCDDTDPTVSSLRAEICGNFKDDNCDGRIDEQPCSVAANDECGTALAVTAPGTFLLDTTASKKDYATTCTVTSPAASRDIVLAITVPAGAARDVLVRARTSAPANEVAVAIQATCGQAASEINCGRIAAASDARTIARSVAAGATVYAIVTTQAESAVDVTVDMPAASTKPTNESCDAPAPVALETPFTVSLVDPAKDLASDCAQAKTGELTYSFTLTEPRDVRIFASTLLGAGAPVVSMRYSVCADELRCRAGTTPPVFARNLPAGTHVFSVAGTTQIDANIVVRTYPPTPTPPNQSCATAPDIAPNTTVAVNLAGQEDAIKNGCLAGGPNAAYKLDLAAPSDVLLIGRFPSTEIGAVSLNQAACGSADLMQCGAGSTPQRVSRRNVGAGSYRAVIADEKGLATTLTALVRPTVPPTTVTSDDCVNPQTIPETGGFFTGDTTTATPDFNAGCDSPGQPIGGAPDQLMRLVLTQQRRVVFDMSGSTNTTVLDIRAGTTCPGVEVPNACNAGLGPNRSFLDVTLAAGTYWVQIDGYAGAVGPWNLDVRVLPP
ncbi:MAG: putative metal-binding motif-containing protein [Labilithrix sp.]|nr:putative metal-binding motif-containing protein [Labilithrix sp.]